MLMDSLWSLNNLKFIYQEGYIHNNETFSSNETVWKSKASDMYIHMKNIVLH